MSISTVSIIGSGNLATHLAKALAETHLKIIQICSQHIEHAMLLADRVKANAICDISKLEEVDLVVLCVTDSAISSISKDLSPNSFVVHTSGSKPMNILSRHAHHGVVYPFQTFSKDSNLAFSDVPVFLEADSDGSLLLLKEVAEQITRNVRVLNSEQRLKLHLAAVFANNFSNHMYTIAKEILDDAGIPFPILNHLIEETTFKAVRSGEPSTVQTGPAIRHNLDVMEQHKDILVNKPLWQKIYTFVSASIMERETDK
jgi:predicted short-subunit dehydrogenase-like oxidoreductase (DUF2520 family)